MDTIESRLKQFIQMEAISPASFADSLGMQRSGLSHLINGRNKPSYDFISKMLNAYPDLNAEWLILGKGKPYKNASHQKELAVTPSEDFQMGNFFAETQSDEEEEFPGQLAESQMNDATQEPYQPRENPIFEPTLEADERISKPEQQKTISKVIIFYSDGSYEER